MTTTEIAVLGVGMHKWGKFPGKTFVDIGVEAARNALDDSGIEWDEIQFLSGANTVRNGYPGGCQHLHLPMHWGFKDVK